LQEPNPIIVILATKLIQPFEHFLVITSLCWIVGPLLYGLRYEYYWFHVFSFLKMSHKNNVDDINLIQMFYQAEPILILQHNYDGLTRLFVITPMYGSNQIHIHQMSLLSWYLNYSSGALSNITKWSNLPNRGSFNMQWSDQGIWEN